jgi:curved DNA-binding protein CbpA
MGTADTQPDYYGILGVPRYASEEGIRRAYIRKAWQHHPDLHADDPDPVVAMRDVNAAYETLSDPVLRTRYDSLRTTIKVRPDCAPADRPFSAGQVHFSPGSLHAPRARRHHRHFREPGFLDTICLLIHRLARYVSV